MSAVAAAAVPRETKAPRPVAVLDDILLELIDIGDNVRDDPGDLTELKASIEELGVIEPIKVTKQPDGRYQVVVGQRRVLSSRELGLARILAIVEPPSDIDKVGPRRSIEQLAENLIRKDLNPIEEAVALREVLDADPALNQAELARRLGMSAPWVSNTLGLLDVAAPVRELIRDEKLSAGHAKALRGLDPKTQAELAKAAVAAGASAHGLEQSVQQHKRSEEWRLERAAAERRAAEASKDSRQASLANLEKKKVAKDAQVVVDPAYNGHAETVVKEIQALGYTNVKAVASGHSSARPKGDLCDCLAWRVVLGEKNGGKLSISRACVSDKHQRVKVLSEEQARKDKYELERLVQAKLNEVGWEQVKPSAFGEARIHMTPLVARMALWHALSYSAGDWSEKNGGKRGNPWATICALTAHVRQKHPTAAAA